MTESIKYVYSHDNEYFNYDDEKSAVEGALLVHGNESLKSVTIYRGKAHKHTHENLAWDIGDAIKENLQEQAYDKGGEYAEDYLADLTKDQERELSSLVIDWLNKNAEQPTFYNVTDVEEYEVKL